MVGGATPWTFMYALEHGYVSAYVRASGASPPPWFRRLEPINILHRVWYNITHAKTTWPLSEGGTQLLCTNEAPMASCLSCYYS
jgi:hypothetical protein